MSERDFDTEFWEIVTYMAARDHIVRILASSAVENSTEINFNDLPPNAQQYVYDNFGLNTELASKALSLAGEMPRRPKDG